MIDDEIDDLDGDDYEPTPEERAASEQFYRLAARFPTFLLLMKVVQSHRRLASFREFKAPDPITEQEERMREKALDDLCNAIPADRRDSLFTLPVVLATFGAELERPHDKGGSDA